MSKDMNSMATMGTQSNIIERYRDSKYPFSLTDAIKCLFCSQILILAQQTNCGCRYCKACLEEYLKSSKKCLGTDCEEIDSVMPDNAVNREIGNMKVSCLFKSKGCVYEDSLKNMNKHLENCEYKPIECSKCKELVIKHEMDKHLVDDCLMRNVKCEHCQKWMPLDKLNNIHLNLKQDDICEKMLGVCPNNCSNKAKVLLRNHLATCKNRPLDCPYSEFGCKDRFISPDINKHLIDEIFDHSTRLITNFKNEISALKEMCNNLSKECKSLMDEKKILKEDISKLQQDPSRPSRATASIMRNRDSIVIHRNGTYIWKIEKFQSLKLSAENGEKLSVTSEPFYTKEFGYKMSMKIYPAGDGVGKGTHLSVFFTLMRGDYDDLLPWPFKNKVTLTIMDQKNKTTDYSDTFKPDPRSTCYQQPTEEYNIASGSPKFITFDQLNETYLKKDSIFLKIHVLS